ncbi:MAG: hypothetical protein CSA32_02345 [Desulfobulbus propionicus]|nr:MAG: hypothetical protein CSA32_02345 [Desulfobulbus propionicus]
MPAESIRPYCCAGFHFDIRTERMLYCIFLSDTKQPASGTDQGAASLHGCNSPLTASTLSTLLCRILLVFFSPYAALPCVIQRYYAAQDKAV